MIFSEAVTSVTREKIVPRVYDQVTKGSPTLMVLLQQAAEWNSGTEYDFPIQYQDSTNGGNTGIADRLDTDRQNTRTKARFTAKMTYKPVVVADIEIVLNQGDERVVDLLQVEFDTQAKSLCTLMAQNLYTGNGTGDDWDSIDNAADDGTNYATYGMLSRTTYTAWKGYYLASVGALTLAKLATGYDAVTIGTDEPTHIITTKSLWSVYESLLTPTVRAGYNQGGYPKMNAFGMVSNAEALAGQQGFGVLFFRGTAIVKDEQVPSGRLYYMNTTDGYFGFKGIDLSGTDRNIRTVNFKKRDLGVPTGVPGRVPSTRGFNFRDLMSPVDQLAEVGHVIYAGNFVATECRLQGQLRGVTA